MGRERCVWRILEKPLYSSFRSLGDFSGSSAVCFIRDVKAFGRVVMDGGEYPYAEV